MSAATVWLIVAVVAGIVEILHRAFGFVFVSLAALLAAGCAALGLPVLWQIVVFAATLVGSLILLRPLFVGRLAGVGVPSRTDAIVGKLGRVVEAIDPVLGIGRVIVGGHDWAARSVSSIAAGQEVRVDGADGIVLLVSPAPPGQQDRSKADT